MLCSFHQANLLIDSTRESQAESKAAALSQFEQVNNHVGKLMAVLMVFTTFLGSVLSAMVHFNAGLLFIMTNSTAVGKYCSFTTQEAPSESYKF